MSVAASDHAAPAQQARVELADVFARYADAYFGTHGATPAQRKVARAIVRCRTAALGGHREWCQRCGFQRYLYHSCRNRHCPKCQSLAKASWLENRQQELLPTPYFHNVFTLPHELNPLLLASEGNRHALLDLLFHTVADTLLTFGHNNLGGKVGFTLVLHTWDQQLRAHFHVHCVIAGGAITEDGRKWIPAGKSFLFPVRALSKVFRAKYIERLQHLLDKNELDLPTRLTGLTTRHGRRRWIRLLRRKAWVVYSKAPFAGPRKLLDYLGRYTHRVAISNHRVLSSDDGQVRFTYRDRSDGDRRKIAALPGEEFIRRFLLHVLPPRFMRIRHYGFLANRAKKTCLAQCREQLGTPAPEPAEEKTAADWIRDLTGIDITRCPRCGAPLQREEVSPLRFQFDPPPPTLNYWDTS